MQLCVDIGNTRVKTGLFKQDELLHHDVSDLEPVYVIKEAFDKNPEIKALIISSVRKELDIDLIPMPETIHHILFDFETLLPIKNLYESKESLGQDRIALAVGAHALFPGENCLIFDAGTCLTMEFINQRSQYLGGSISPGIQMRLDSMHQGTAKLPKILLNKTFKPGLGKNTKDCMMAGAVNGIINEINGAIASFKTKYKDLRVIVTGGDIKIFEKELKSAIFADPNLVLRGLNKILLHNIERP